MERFLYMKPGNPWGKDVVRHGSDDWVARQVVIQSKPKPSTPPRINPYVPPPYRPPVGPQPRDTILPRGGDYGHPPKVTSNLPTFSKKTLLILCLAGVLVGTVIAVNTHINPLAGAFLGLLGGLFAVPLIVLAFRILKVVLVIAVVVFVLYLLVHFIGH
jgi:hypothetical protein